MWLSDDLAALVAAGAMADAAATAAASSRGTGHVLGTVLVWLPPVGDKQERKNKPGTWFHAELLRHRCAAQRWAEYVRRCWRRPSM